MNRRKNSEVGASTVLYHLFILEQSVKLIIAYINILQKTEDADIKTVESISDVEQMDTGESRKPDLSDSENSRSHCK